MQLLSFSDILKYFSVDNVNPIAMIEKGENALKSDHLLQFELNKGVIQAIVRRSFVKDPKQAYKLQVTLPSGKDGLQITCECPNGNYRCHHMAAVSLYIKDNISQTDMECQWVNPHKKPRLLESNIEKLHNSYKNKQIQEAVVLNSSDKEYLINELDPLGAFGVHWLYKLNDSNSVSLKVSNSTVSILKSKLLPSREFDLQNIRQCLTKTNGEIIEIRALTIGQRKNPKWFEYRKFVLTSSTFGKVLHQIRINRFPISFFKTLHGMYNSGSSKSIKFGQDNESIAINKYIEITKNHVVETGLHLLPCGFIGGSPDGLVGDDGLLEVKCSFLQHRTLQSFTTLAGTKNFYLEMNGKKLRLKRSHEYYHQVQGNLHITGRKYCDFFVWSPVEYFLETIELDIDWSQNIQILDNFYFTHFLKQSLLQLPNLEL